MDRLGPTLGAPLGDRDWLAFFRDLYLGFGPPEEMVLRCVRRAYRDFNRTWHGVLDPAGRRAEARAAGEAAVVGALSALAGRRLNQPQFDAWHADARRAIMRATDPGRRGRGLTLGQAQKWINMAVKYAVGGRLPGFEHLEPLAHVPIDRILLAELARVPRVRPALALLPEGAWSRLADERAYEAFQREVRSLAAPLSPLALEFSLWLAAQQGQRGVLGRTTTST